ncbi:uncharacterized protein LOC142925628 isoform X2 [Petromyzon marinus]|uniref:uncharacterized protein LOC142925628 isoform X2 n=1 Tax=Petromyzon marinus TaxID=7757 RepID=UPI003F7114EB
MGVSLTTPATSTPPSLTRQLWKSVEKCPCSGVLTTGSGFGRGVIRVGGAASSSHLPPNAAVRQRAGPPLHTKLPPPRPRRPCWRSPGRSAALRRMEGTAEAAALEAGGGDGNDPRRQGDSSSSRRNTANEKRRRERINESCIELQRLLPACRDLRSDRICILEMATDLIAYTKRILPAETLCQALSSTAANGSGGLPQAATPKSDCAHRPAAASEDHRADPGVTSRTGDILGRGVFTSLTTAPS